MSENGVSQVRKTILGEEKHEYRRDRPGILQKRLRKPTSRKQLHPHSSVDMMSKVKEKIPTPQAAASL